MVKSTTKAGGSSTLMPIVKLSLGKYVIVRPRADGTYRVLFELPPRLRPPGWLPTTPLPRSGSRTGDLTNLDEVARIRRDAEVLYKMCLAARDRGAEPPPKERTLKTLVGAWERSEAYRATKPRTKQGYQWIAVRIIAWAKAQPRQPDPVTMRRADVEAFLRDFNDRPSLKWHMRKVLRLIMDQAIALGWRLDNPVDGVKVKMPRSQVSIWEQADVDAYVWAAATNRQPWLAALIMTEWEIGQRLTDVVLFRRGAEYDVDQGVFRFRQSKTGGYVTIPISARLRAVLKACAVDGSLYLFHDGATGRPFPDVGRLGHVFEQIREHVIAGGGRHLVLRALRHSCVVQIARNEGTVPEIAAITGHSIQTVGSILSTYLPRDNEVAWSAQRKRGLIGDA